MVLEGALSSVHKGVKHTLGPRGRVLGTGSVGQKPGHTSFLWPHMPAGPWPEKGQVPHTGRP